jgi:hypothetical protein
MFMFFLFGHAVYVSIVQGHNSRRNEEEFKVGNFPLYILSNLRQV